MKDIKEKPTAHMPRSNATGEIPKAALKKAWAEAKEKSRTMLRESTSTQGDGDYTTAQDTSSVVTDTSYSVIKQNTDFTVQQGRKIARKQILSRVLFPQTGQRMNSVFSILFTPNCDHSFSYPDISV